MGWGVFCQAWYERSGGDAELESHVSSAYDLNTSFCLSSCRWCLHLWQQLSVQKLQVQIMQKKLLFLLPCGVYQVRSGLHLQRAACRKVQLLQVNFLSRSK